MQKFCKKCGNRLDDKTGRCPNCDKSLSKKEIRAKKRADKKAAKKASKKEAWQKLPLGKKFKKICIRIVIVILLLAVLTGAGVATLVYFDIVDIPVISKAYEFFGIKNYKENEDASEEDEALEDETVLSTPYSVEAPDAEEYFQNNSTIVSEVDAKDSDKTMTEEEAYNLLNDRGFTGDSIVTEYSMDGEYSTAVDISQSSSTEHPMYQTLYESSTGEIWTVYLINGSIMAYPISYNVESENDFQTVISETETVFSYDGTTNRFYETIPEQSVMKVSVVEKIDSQTLDELTEEVIDNL